MEYLLERKGIVIEVVGSAAGLVCYREIAGNRTLAKVQVHDDHRLPVVGKAGGKVHQHEGLAGACGKG